MVVPDLTSNLPVPLTTRRCRLLVPHQPQYISPIPRPSVERQVNVASSHDPSVILVTTDTTHSGKYIKTQPQTTTAAATPSRKRRAVTFEQEYREPRIVSSAYCVDDKSQLWYSRDELAELKRAAKRTCLEKPREDEDLNEIYCRFFDVEARAFENKEPAELIDAGQSVSTNAIFQEHRGLERWCSKRHALSRDLTLLQARTELFVEQSSQLLQGRNDPERLASLYSEVTQRSSRFARVLGIADAVEANKAAKL